jgi:hypothetical protein
VKNLKRYSITLVLLAACFAAGCTNLVIGRPINKQKIDEIIAGETTKDDIRSDGWFGTPLHVVPGSDGEIWVYRYMTGNNRVEELTIGFADDTVSCFYKE